MGSETLSRRLLFHGLNNTRDLGGMNTTSGCSIASGKLIRSGHLHSATDEDITQLSETVEMVFDFRTEQERLEKPDPDISGAQIIHLPIFESLAAGVTREEKSDEAAFAMVARDPEKAYQYMLNTYLGFVTSDFSISQYSRFVYALLEPHDKAVLWHCTAGKDRAGFASVIVQEVLGVDRDNIFADYLSTNDYLETEIVQLCNMVGQQMGGLDEKFEQALRFLFGANEKYLAGIYEKANELYGGFDSFLSVRLGITDDKRKKLQDLYLRS